MLARATAATPWGVDARAVQVEVDVRNGLPQTQIVGLPDTAVRESRERVRAALKNCGFDLPPRAVVINLAPADLRKEGNHLDLAIAMALLAAHGQLPEETLEGRVLSGELGLDGTIRSVRGGLAIADLGARLGARELLLPAPNAGEAAALGAIPVIPVESLGRAIEHLLGTQSLAAASPLSREAPARDQPDLSEVRGQEVAKRALEIAAAGGHNLLFIGPPGAGKTMLARRLPGILPPLSLAESIAVTKVYSLVAEQPPSGLIRIRPFRSPHPGTSMAGMVGGGSIPRPGEASLAHAGVLFLDELPEFHRDALESLRQPLEEGEVTVVRARARLRFPASFTLLAAMNPCPCGHLGDPNHECGCTQAAIDRYRGKISGPLLDRIDMHIEVPPVALGDLRSAPGESSATIAARVLAARELQRQRFSTHAALTTNSAMGSEAVHRYCRPDDAGRRLLDRAFHSLGLSARAVIRILKVARTVADLDQHETIQARHIAEAIQYRTLDRRLVS